MKLEDYQLILNLKEYGTIRATAKKILISQPALTQRLKYIEEYLGGLIFLRTSKKLLPTPFGEVVLDHAATVMKREEQLWTRLAKAKGKVAGTLSIGASSLFSQYFLPDILEKFTAQHPEVTIDLVTGVSEEIRQNAHSFHICIVRGEPLKDYEKFHLLDDPLYLFDRYPLRSKLTRPFIEFKSDPEFQKLIERWMYAQDGLLFKRSIKVDHFETAKQMMSRGLGMTVLPESICSNEKNHFEYIPLTMEGKSIVRETWACIKPGLRDLPQVEAFMKHIEVESL
ncbi:LysR family transcriptional regulator [Halobacillus sp. H74]|uniref:LysR family transcriptional regulator n=1 Tax=Halobacillus sp. H74 TaxID=3457436 RepID=UPI003FCE2740